MILRLRLRGAVLLSACAFVVIIAGLPADCARAETPAEWVKIYQDGPSAPRSCVVDGIMLAIVSTPGQDLLRVRSGVAVPNIFGIALISDPKTGRTLRYVLPRSDRPLMDAVNNDPSPLHRYEAVMSASGQRLFRVEE